MSQITETEGEATAPSPALVCIECQSSNVRPSHSTYPLDQSKVAGTDQSFWRCENCGRRFPGPQHPEREPGHRRRGSRRRKDSLTEKVKLARGLKRYLFPILVILSTIIAVVYMLDRRNSRQEQTIISPD